MRKDRYIRDFSIDYGLVQIIERATGVPDETRHQAKLLDFSLTPWPVKCSIKVPPQPHPLGTSDHSIVSVQIDAKPKIIPDLSVFRTTLRDSTAD